jgi:predicted DNA-binding transcriptional regulator
MPSDRALGGGILAGSVLGIVVYGVLLYLHPLRVLEVTAFVAIVVLLGILAWIGWTMATTPPPEPIAEPAQTPPVVPQSAERNEA